MLARYATAEAALLAEATAAAVAADEGERALLTAQGGPLVEAVTRALTALGFEVQDADAQEPATAGAPKVEDLRVRDLDEPAWTNITEVRGYKAGAKTSDLQRLSRFAALHAVRKGTLPDSRWYVVNQSLADDPDTRRPALAGSGDDLSVFADDGGLLVDTRDLFGLVRLVGLGTVTSRQTRALLRSSRGTLNMSDLSPGTGT